jgi:hypothetical protein
MDEIKGYGVEKSLVEVGKGGEGIKKRCAARRLFISQSHGLHHDAEKALRKIPNLLISATQVLIHVFFCLKKLERAV